MVSTSVILHSFTSPSDYEASWQAKTPGEPVAAKTHRSNSWWSERFILSPGDFLFGKLYMSDTDDRRILVQAPEDDEGFKQFCEASQAAQSPEAQGSDEWIREFVVHQWDLSYREGADDGPEDWPFDLESALQMSGN